MIWLLLAESMYYDSSSVYILFNDQLILDIYSEQYTYVYLYVFIDNMEF